MSELDKTIEELEAEVLAELEEAEDPAKKGALPAQKSDIKDESDDLGDAEDSGKKAAAKTKEVSGDPQQKGEGAPDKMKKLKAGYHEGFTEEEIRELCHSKDHDCATVIEHPEFGLGKPVHGSHAIPDDEGNVEWYDVQFKHGVEEKVMAEDVKILVSEAHHEDMDMPKTKDALMAAMHKEMKHMKKADLQAAYGSMMKMGMHDEETKQELKHQLKKS